MLDKTKTILVNALFVAVVSIILFAGFTQFRQWSQYSRGEKALAAELEQTRRVFEIHLAARQNRQRAKRNERRLNPQRKP